MRALLLVATILVFGPGSVHAASVSVSDQNSTLKFSYDDPTSNLNVPNDPVQLPRSVEWTVDGRRILVYPSSPLTFIDLGHYHFGGHVGPNQIHSQGPMLGYGSSAMDGTVTGGVVYTVNGGAPGSGVSRISEKVDIRNKSNAGVSVLLAGLGFKPVQSALEVPDLSGLTVTGTTVVIYQGAGQSASITDMPFAPVTVLPVTSFTGFNPLLNQSLTLPAGAVLTMVTELKVAPAPWLTVVTLWWLLAVIVLAAAAAMVVRKRREGA